MGEAVAALVDAAARLRPLDPLAARDALLSALESAAFAGWASSAPLLEEIARIAQDLPPTGDPPGLGANLLLQGYTARLTDGYAAVSGRCAAPFGNSSPTTWTLTSPSDASNRPPITAAHLHDAAAERLTAHWIDRARESGALARPAGGLAFRSAFVDGPRDGWQRPGRPTRRRANWGR